MSESAAPRPPATTWEYAVSTADQLVLWCADTEPEVGQEPLRTRTVVVLGAAIYDQARDSGLEGASVIGVPLARVHDALRWHAASVLEACPAPPHTGGEERDWLLAQYGTPEGDLVVRVAQDVVNRHLADADPHSGDVYTSISDRRPALRERAGQFAALHTPEEEGF